jgi:uncharacterized membrane-anchored protein
VTGRDRAALVLIVLALVAAVFELFYRPFGIALPALVVTMVGISISDRYRRLGWYATLAITLGFLIGASFAVWDSRPLY